MVILNVFLEKILSYTGKVKSNHMCDTDVIEQWCPNFCNRGPLIQE